MERRQRPGETVITNVAATWRTQLFGPDVVVQKVQEEKGVPSNERYGWVSSCLVWKQVDSKELEWLSVEAG